MKPAIPTILIVLLLTGCASLPKAESGESELLYTGADVTLQPINETSIPGRRSLQRELEQGLQPIPNTTWLGGLRPGLWIYRITGTPDEPGLRRWVADRFAEQPVLYQENIPQQGEIHLRNRLFNRGFFDTEINHQVDRKKQFARVHYTVLVGEQYHIASVQYPQGNTPLKRELQQAAAESLIEPGQPYRLETLRAERARLDRHLKEQGFFAFNPAFLVFDAAVDTEQRLVDLTLTIESPEEARQRYRISSIAIYADYSVERPLPEEPTHHLTDTISYYERHPRFDPEVILASLLFRPGNTYSRSQHVNSIHRLMRLDVFQFVNIRYEQNHQEGTIHAQVLLTPAASRNLEGELRAVTRSDGFAGPGFSAAWTDRNLSGGAERLRIESSAGLETSLGTDLFSIQSYEIAIESTLTVPRIAGPLRLLEWIDLQGDGRRLPETSLRTGVSRRGHIGQYALDQAEIAYGYEWGNSIAREFRPLELTAIHVGGMNDSFSAQLETDAGLQQIYRTQLLAGTSYRLRYSRHGEDTIGRQVSARIDAGVNLLDPQPYVRLDTEGRVFFPMPRDTLLAMRASVGAGRVLYGDTAIPPIRQFGIGGGSSIRAFHPRSIGPGTVLPNQDSQRTGELRLESSLEYRFRLIGFMNAAAFVDAGNIWMLSGDTGRADPDTLLSEIAVGAGVGLRFDAQIVVLRMDAAVPLRKPWLPAGQRWTTTTIDFTDQQWRRENLVFSLAIGYPF